MPRLPSIAILAIAALLPFHGVLSHTLGLESTASGQKSLQAPPFGANTVSEFSPPELERTFQQIPPVDHVVLFYINLNANCRNFFPLFSHLYNDLAAEGLKLRFVKFNCQGADRRLKMCQDYNISLVPTVVYVSSYRLQRDEVPPRAYVRRLLRRLLWDANSDVRVPNATRYRGDVFAYEQLRDWAMLMYNISTLNRRLGTREELARFLRGLWRSLTGRPR